MIFSNSLKGSVKRCLHVFSLTLILLGCIFLCDSNAATRKLLRPEPSYPTIASVTAHVLPRVHLERREVDDEISKRALFLYLRALDYHRLYFLESDIKAMEAFTDKLDDAVKGGDLSFGFKTYELFLRRMRQRVAFVEKLLSSPPGVTSEGTFNWDRKEAAWCLSREELDQLWEKKIKNEYIGELLAREERKRREEEHEREKKKLIGTSLEVTSAEPASTTTAASGTTEESASVATAEAAQAEDKTDDADDEADLSKLSPEEAIIKRYRQQRTVLEDNDAEWVLQTYLSSFVMAYDPHSSYMSPSEEKDFDISMKLSLFGIGALLSPDDGTAKVVRLIPGGPAEKDGRLKANDRIIGVGQGDGAIVDTVHWPLTKTVKLIRGAKGTKVVLLIRKGSGSDSAPPVKIDIIRDEVKLEDQAAKGETWDVKSPLNNEVIKVGVISLPAFYMDFAAAGSGNDYRSSTRDVRRIISEFRKQGVRGVIMDLRNNGGGSLTEAVSMTGLFIKDGPVVQVKQNQGFFSDGKQVLKDEDSSIEWDGPLAVIISRVSASASEIFAGAIQDYHRGVVIGDSRTHGKGSVQTIYPVSKFIRSFQEDPLGSLKVTMAQFYRVNGESTQRKGVESDIIIPSVLEYMEVGEDKQPFALPFDVIDPAPHDDSQAVFPELIKVLNERSTKRRAADERFIARRELFKKIKDRQDDKSVSVNIEVRRQQREVERKLLEEQEKLSEEATGQLDADNRSKDLVLEESARILGDLILSRTASSGVDIEKIEKNITDILQTSALQAQGKDGIPVISQKNIDGREKVPAQKTDSAPFTDEVSSVDEGKSVEKVKNSAK